MADEKIITDEQLRRILIGIFQDKEDNSGSTGNQIELPLSIGEGGTGATTSSEALRNLGIEYPTPEELEEVVESEILPVVVGGSSVNKALTTEDIDWAMNEIFQ